MLTVENHKSANLFQWNHPVFHKFIAQSEYPNSPHPASFYYNSLLVSGSSSLKAPCYIIMIFLHNAVKRAHSTQMTLCKAQRSCQSPPSSTKHRLIKNLICQDLQPPSTFSTTFQHL